VSKADSVDLPRAVRRAIVDHALRARPRECCGLLIGRGRRVSFAVPMRNIARGPTRYRLDDAAHIRVRRMAWAFVPPAAVIGVYHSHPAGPARPSATDLAEAFYPEWVYVIVGLRPAPAVRGFRIRGGESRAVRLVAAVRRARRKV
jgi:proteasome lid subunit RPN8/RPN11